MDDASLLGAAAQSQPPGHNDQHDEQEGADQVYGEAMANGKQGAASQAQKESGDKTSGVGDDVGSRG